MKIAITGANGFLGRKLTAKLLADNGVLMDGEHRPVTSLHLTDLVAAAFHAETPFPVTSNAADITAPQTATDLIGDGMDLVFHLAAIVSADAEANFDTGMAVNFDASRQIADAMRASGGGRLVFASSVAVFGENPEGTIYDRTWPVPQTSYGSQKTMAETLINDMSRKGFIDGRSVRLPTVVVRPGKPNKAASTFASSIIREPLQGHPATCPVSEDAAMYVASPRTIIDNLLHAANIAGERWQTNRSLMLPGLSVSVAEMLETLEAVAGPEARSRVSMAPDPAIQKIIAGWPSKFDTARAAKLGFKADQSYRAIVEAFMADDMVKPR